MAHRSTNPASRRPRDLEVTFEPLTIRSLDYRHIAKPLDVRLVDRVRGEFREMPGLSPTLNQAARLFNASQAECGRILALLIKEGFLCERDGRYRLTSQR